MMKHGKIIILLCIIILGACTPVPYEEMDMVAAKQFVSEVKRMDSGEVMPLPRIEPAKPLTNLAGEPFQYKPPAIIDDWHKQALNIRGKGGGQR